MPRLVAHGPVLVKVGGLTLLAIAALFLSSTSTLRNCVLALQGDSSLPDLFPSSSTLPLRLIVFLEVSATHPFLPHDSFAHFHLPFPQFSATLLSLLSPLVKLNNPRLSRRLPGTIFLPSPSHAPPVVDLLPLPPGLADILSGRASDMQSRNGRRGPFRGSRTNTVRHGVIQGLALVPEAAEEHQRGRQEDRWAGGLQDPLTLPTEQSHEGTGLAANGKAPRRRGLQVQVDSNWLLENVVILWGYLVGAIEYLVVTVREKTHRRKGEMSLLKKFTHLFANLCWPLFSLLIPFQLSLPTLSPTSLPPILALLSLRSQLGALVVTWISARRSLECLEFVRRRWPSSSLSLAETSPRWRADEEEEILCPICLEPIQSESGEEAAPFGAESCLLDCGHKLHAVSAKEVQEGDLSSPHLTHALSGLSCANLSRNKASFLPLLSRPSQSHSSDCTSCSCVQFADSRARRLVRDPAASHDGKHVVD